MDTDIRLTVRRAVRRSDVDKIVANWPRETVDRLYGRAYYEDYYRMRWIECSRCRNTARFTPSLFRRDPTTGTDDGWICNVCYWVETCPVIRPPEAYRDDVPAVYASTGVERGRTRSSHFLPAHSFLVPVGEPERERRCRSKA